MCWVMWCVVALGSSAVGCVVVAGMVGKDAVALEEAVLCMRWYFGGWGGPCGLCACCTGCRVGMRGGGGG